MTLPDVLSIQSRPSSIRPQRRRRCFRLPTRPSSAPRLDYSVRSPVLPIQLIGNVLSMFTTRRLHPRRVPSWEVITSQSVEAAVSPLDFDDAPHRKHSLSTMSAGHTASHFNEAVSDDEHTRTYAFDLPAMHGMPTTDDARRAVRTARERMIAELSRRRSTSPGSRSSSVESGAPLVQLSHERWSFAIMRRESSYRIQVAYFAKINGLAHPEVDQVDPPFLEVIDSRSW